MKADNFNIEQLAYDLQGTCQSLEQSLNSLYGEDMHAEDLTQEDLYALDDLVFECVTCGWWYETGEASENEEENECIDCYNDN